MNKLNINELKFKCCFCNKGILSNKTDPCDVNVLVNIDKPSDKQYNQTFYCHLECFRAVMHDDIRSNLALECLVDG